MSTKKHLLRDRSITHLARFHIVRFVLGNSIWLCLLSSPALASGTSYDPSSFNAIFGDPNVFVNTFREGVSPKLNEYIGLSVSVAAFIWVLRSLFS